MILDTIKNALASFAVNFASSAGQGVANKVFGETLEDKQRYALEQMEHQAQLNRENFDYQFDRQLQVTDPSFIRQRWERAGLSPSLAFSNGASSPGISAQMGSSSTPGGISSSLRSGQMVNIAESLARIRNLDADTEGKKTETDYNQKAMQTRLDILSQDKLSKIYSNNIARIDSLYKEDVTLSTLDKLKKEMDAITFDMSNRKDLTDIERQKLNGYLESLTHQYSLWQSQIDLNEAKTDTEESQQILNRAKSDTEESQQILNRAKSALASASKEEVFERMQNYSKQREQINATIERIGKENALTDEQIREIKHNIALRWAIFGVNTAKVISQEFRDWVNPLSALKDLKSENRALLDMLQDKDIYFAD